MSRNPNSKNPLHNPKHAHHIKHPDDTPTLSAQEAEVSRALSLAKQGIISFSDLKEEPINDKQDRLSFVRTYNK